MKVKLKTTLAGPKGSHQAGNVVDFPEAEAEQLIKGGFAEAVKDPEAEAKAKEEAEAKATPVTETAEEKPEIETAATRTGKPKGKKE